ncbi:MAG: hypothetical protein V4466_09340 [Pseudomonadota bacterium]
MSLSPALEVANDPEARHVLRFSASGVALALDAVRAGLAASPAELCNLQLKSLSRGLVEAVLRVQQIDEDGAVSLCHRLGERPGVLSSRVEHLWGKS